MLALQTWFAARETWGAEHCGRAGILPACFWVGGPTILTPRRLTPAILADVTAQKCDPKCSSYRFRKEACKQTRTEASGLHPYLPPCTLSDLLKYLARFF